MVAEEITAWQTRPLDSFYAILYIDALTVKVRDGGTVDNKAAYLVTGVDIDGFNHVLGIWMAASEGARFWAGCVRQAYRARWSASETTFGEDKTTTAPRGAGLYPSQSEERLEVYLWI